VGFSWRFCRVRFCPRPMTTVFSRHRRAKTAESMPPSLEAVLRVEPRRLVEIVQQFFLAEYPSLRSHYCLCLKKPDIGHFRLALPHWREATATPRRTGTDATIPRAASHPWIFSAFLHLNPRRRAPIQDHCIANPSLEYLFSIRPSLPHRVPLRGTFQPVAIAFTPCRTLRKLRPMDLSQTGQEYGPISRG